MKKYTNYKITNLIDGKVYIGYHYGTEDDGYLCSAGENADPHFWNAIRKYEPGCNGLSVNDIKKFYAKNGFVNFHKETIQYFDDEDSTKEGERYWIAFYRNLLGNENVYNISDGGDDGWTGVNRWLDENPEIRSENLKKAAREGKHPWQNLTPEQLSIRAINGAKTLGPEGTLARSRKASDTMGPEGLSARASKIAKTQLANGTHPFQNLTTEQCSERGKKCAENLGPEGCHDRSLKAAATQKIEWVFFNPTDNTYKVHNLYWRMRLKEGYTERLCYFSSWPQYCIDHDLDPNLINN